MVSSSACVVVLVYVLSIVSTSQLKCRFRILFLKISIFKYSANANSCQPNFLTNIAEYLTYKSWAATTFSRRISPPNRRPYSKILQQSQSGALKKVENLVTLFLGKQLVYPKRGEGNTCIPFHEILVKTLRTISCSIVCANSQPLDYFFTKILFSF